MANQTKIMFEGRREFDAALKVSDERMLEAARNIVSKGALVIAGEAKKTFRGRPGGQMTSKKTGRTYYSFKPPYQAIPPTATSRSGKLQNSVGSFYRVTLVEGGWMAETGTKVKYAKFVEFGTSRMAKEPFLETGIDHSRGEIERLAEYEWARAVA